MARQLASPIHATVMFRRAQMQLARQVISMTARSVCLSCKRMWVNAARIPPERLITMVCAA
ncbi:hypothetical protein LINPERHAP2_LOCUS29676 [Linum perenne]